MAPFIKQEVKRMNLIKQIDDTGCGIACVAMLLGKPYEKVREEMFKAKGWTAKKRSLRTHAGDLSLILGDVQHEMIQYESFDSVQGASILAVNPDDKKKYHWVVAFRSAGCLWIADSELGELYRYDNWNENVESGYRLADFYSIVFPRLEISSVVFA